MEGKSLDSRDRGLKQDKQERRRTLNRKIRRKICRTPPPLPATKKISLKTTCSYFPGMFKNPAPAKHKLKKPKQKYYEILTINECVEKKSMTVV